MKATPMHLCLRDFVLKFYLAILEMLWDENMQKIFFDFFDRVGALNRCDFSGYSMDAWIKLVVL